MCETDKECAKNAVPEGTVRVTLGLEAWEIRYAAEIGLLAKGPRGKYCKTMLDTAVSDLETFKYQLDKEKLLNFTEASERAHVPVDIIRSSVDHGLLKVMEVEYWKYGIIRRVRAGDLDDMADEFAFMMVDKMLTASVNRSNGAKKAAVTRQKRQNETRKAMFNLLEFEKELDLPSTSVIRAAKIGTGLHKDDKDCHTVPREWFTDKLAEEVAAALFAAKPRKEELERMRGKAKEATSRALEVLAGPGEVRKAAAPAALSCMAKHVENIAGWIPKGNLETWLIVRPDWLIRGEEEARIEETRKELMRIEREVLKEHAREAEKIRRQEARELEKLAEAVNAAIQITDDMVADLLSLPVELIVKLRPGSGRWSKAMYEQFEKRAPSWSKSVEAAEKEIREREERTVKRGERRARNKVRRALKQENYRKSWARILDVPLEVVPVGIGNPTTDAVKALKAHPPRWYVAAKLEQE